VLASGVCIWGDPLGALVVGQCVPGEQARFDVLLVRKGRTVIYLNLPVRRVAVTGGIPSEA
jgi:hypothetical protein